MWVLVTQSCPTLCNPMNCSLPGSLVHGILQARILEWGAIPFSRDRTRVSHIAGRFFTNWTTREAQESAIFQFRKKEFIAYKTWRTRTYTGNQPCSINMGRDPWMWPPRWSWGSWALGGDWSHFDYLPVLPCHLAFMLFPLNIYNFFN